MKRMIRRITCLCVLLSLYGCAAEPIPTDPASIPVETLELQATVTCQGDEYTQIHLLPDVTGQQVPALLSVRSDGTLDYIFRRDRSSDGSVQFSGYQYLTISPDGTVTRQSTDWLGQLDDALAAINSASAGAYRWELTFSAWEGDLLICAQAQTLAEGTTDHTALYRVRGGVLSQVPLRWDRQDAQIDGIYPVEDGFLVSAGNGHLLDLYAYDGTKLMDIRESCPEMKTLLGVGGSVAWFLDSRSDTVSALDLKTGDVLAEQTCEVDYIRRCAVSPDGETLYLLSTSYTSGKVHFARITGDGTASVVRSPSQYSFGSIWSLPSRIASSVDGTFYTITETEKGITLLQYIPTEKETIP